MLHTANFSPPQAWTQNSTGFFFFISVKSFLSFFPVQCTGYKDAFSSSRSGKPSFPRMSKSNYCSCKYVTM